MWDADESGSPPTSTDRGVSPVIGVIFLVAVVVMLAAIAGTMFMSLGQDGLDSAAVHTQVHYDIQTEMNNEHLKIRANGIANQNTQLVVQINGKRVKTWDGSEAITIQCLYPNDRITITSETEDQRSTVLLDDFYFTEATQCPQYNTFPNKFKYAVVDGKSVQINDRYAFGLSIDPNGDEFAHDGSAGDKGADVGNISLANEWQYVKLYDRELEGFQPPVFVIVMVDNVHWRYAPHPDHHATIDEEDYYDWSDSPPDSITIGADSFTIEGTSVEPVEETVATEPTDDVYMVFKPGCDQSQLKFIEASGGYHNDVYLNDELLINDTKVTPPGNTTTAQGVDCPGGVDWD